MGKKLIHQVSSAKICKDTDHKKQFNSLINVLKPKVYITDSSNFKKLVQQLTGNGNPISSNIPPSPPSPPPIHQETLNFQIPIFNHIDLDQAFSFDSSIDSSEASFPTSSFATTTTTTLSAESSPDINSETLFLDHILESSSLYVNTKKFDFPACEDIESWLSEIDNYSFNYDDLIQDCLPGINQQPEAVSVYGYDYFSDIDHFI